jgi:pimeloyl-ACP methyl ester carboxylesterase
MGFLVGAGHQRDAVLLAWEFTTQTTTDPLDPAVEGSLAAEVATGPLVGPTGTGTPVSVTGVAANRANYPFLVCDTGVLDGETVLVPPEPDDAQCFLKLTLGGGLGCGTLETCGAAYTAGSARCAAAGCQAIGDVLAGALLAKSYQTETPNPRGNTCGEAEEPCPAVPGPWDDPALPTQVGVEGIGVLIFTTAASCPVNGCPTAIFGHGLGSSREAAFAIAPQLAGVGFATVAIDFVAHGSRRVQISDDPAIGCDPPSGLQCFAPFLSPNLAGTRDNIRQSVLDLHSLAAGLDACGPTECGALEVDPAHVVYIGQSLGGIMGSTFAAASPSLTASVLNVAGVGWADIFENTGSLTIRCSLVDALIDAGVLEGDKLDAIGKEPTGLCLGEEWKTQPGYRQFALIARWVLDPADPANFTGMLATRRVLLQEVVGDEVVPNAATDAEGALLGLAPVDRAAAVPNPEPPPLVLPDRAITESPIESKWLRYHTLPADGGTGFPGNTYQHGSLLAPTPGNDGLLATAAQQIDAIIYLLNNR